MSARFEMIRANDDRVIHAEPGSDFRYGDVLKEGEHALIFGDPEGCALVVIGRSGDLRDYLTDALSALDAEGNKYGEEDW